MKAYHVQFNTAATSGFSEILIVRNENELDTALEAKTTEPFRAGKPYSVITDKTQIPLSKVKIADLSVTEFFMLSRLY